jgi:hypothetical protein
MNTERKADLKREIKQSRLSKSPSLDAAALLGIRILVAIVAVASLLVGSAFAEDRAGSPAREAEISRLRGLAGPGIGSWSRVNEAVHLRGLIEARRGSDVANLDREAEIARLRGLAGPGASSAAVANESVHLLGLLQAAMSRKGAGFTTDHVVDPLQYTTLVALSDAGLEASIAASAARYNGLASHYGRAPRAVSAYAARLQALAGCYGAGRSICSAK